MSRSDLSSWLRYRNADVVSHFSHHHPEYDLAEAQMLFEDLLGWLWVSGLRTQKHKKTYLFGPLLILDDVWHAFILHTRDYYDFCQTYYGSYIHHDVEPVGHEHHVTEEEVVDMLSDCATYLGEDWIRRRFSEALLQDE